MPKAKPKASTAAPVAASITFKLALHSHFAEHVAVLDAAQRHVLMSPAGQREIEKDAIHRALLDRRNAYCAQCLSDGSPGVHPASLDPDAATDDSPFHSLDRGRGVADHCPYGHYKG